MRSDRRKLTKPGMLPDIGRRRLAVACLFALLLAYAANAPAQNAGGAAAGTGGSGGAASSGGAGGTQAAGTEPPRTDRASGAASGSEAGGSGGSKSESPKSTPAGEDSSVEKPPPSELQKQIQLDQATANKVLNKVWKLSKNNTLTAGQTHDYGRQIDALTELLRSFAEDAALVAGQKRTAEAKPDTDVAKRADLSSAKEEEAALIKKVAATEQALFAIDSQLDALAAETGWQLIETLLRARCQTALCFANGEKKYWLGIEPLVELPVGKSFALSNSALTNYVNNHDVRVDLAAGVRMWLFRDLISVSVYISKPLTEQRVRIEGSPFVYPSSSVRRPYPGVALGLFFDTVWLAFDRDELRNGDGEDSTALNPDFPPNQVVSSTWTLTLALQPVTAFRTAIGTAVQKKESK